MSNTQRDLYYQPISRVEFSLVELSLQTYNSIKSHIYIILNLLKLFGVYDGVILLLYNFALSRAVVVVALASGSVLNGVIIVLSTVLVHGESGEFLTRCFQP